MSSITAFLQEDHKRLDQLWEEQREALGSGDFKRAREFFSAFSSGLRLHIRMEEEGLFPVFEEKSGLREAGPTWVMRQEHREIEALLDQIGKVLAQQGDSSPAWQRVREVAGSLEALLKSHNQKEEQVLYPMSDRLLEEGERRALVQRMQILGKEA